MSITLSIGGQSIGIDDLTDLASPSGASTILSLANTVFAGGLDQPVSQLPANASSATLNYTSGDHAWTVGDYTFGLSGSVVGSVAILQAGQSVVSYTKTFPVTMADGLATSTNSTSTGAVVVPAGRFYVQVTLDLSIAASAAVNVPVGAVGISGSVGNSDTFQVSFAKLVDGATPLRDALKQAFAGFVLPLHANTFQHLQPGDYLYHQFNATLSLGFGATYGLDKVFYAGQYTADIPSVPAAPSVNLSAQVGVSVGASVTASFEYTGSFEAMLWKTDANTGHLHLYKSSTTDANFQIGASVAIIANPAVTIDPGSLQQLAAAALPKGTGAVVGKLLAGKAQDQVNAWVGDLQARITSWLTPFQQASSSLQLAIERTRSRFLLTDFTFDLTKPAFPRAWGEAIKGNYAAALAVPQAGVSLDPGSGLEEFHMRKTSLSLNLFGKFEAEWTEASIDNFSVIYAGNNTFHLIENIGRQAISTLNSSGRELDVYFAAQATSNGAGAGAVTHIGDVDLHFTLKATQNGGFGRSIAGVLSSITTGPVSSALTKQMLATAGQKNSIQMLDFVFKPAAYGRLSASTVNGKSIVDEDADQKNFSTFASACGKTVVNGPGGFALTPVMDYGSWATWNIACNDSYPPPQGSHPSRRNPGNISAADGNTYLTGRFGSATSPALIGYAFQAAAGYMDLCEDLKSLATSADGDTWDDLIKELRAILKNDLNVDFVPAIALALANCMDQNNVSPQLSGPAANAPQEPTIAVTLQYS